MAFTGNESNNSQNQLFGVTLRNPLLPASCSKARKIKWFATANHRFPCSTLLGVTCQKNVRCQRHRTSHVYTGDASGVRIDR